jgi:hypothetical protein
VVTKPNTRVEQLGAVTAVLRAIPDPAEQRAVLDALFAEGRKRQYRRSGAGRRAAVDSQRRETTPDSCGTPRGHALHRYHGEEICDACREAHKLEMREWRAAKRAVAAVGGAR